jgi:hypothetical protein
MIDVSAPLHGVAFRIDLFVVESICKAVTDLLYLKVNSVDYPQYQSYTFCFTCQAETKGISAQTPAFSLIVKLSWMNRQSFQDLSVELASGFTSIGLGFNFCCTAEKGWKRYASWNSRSFMLLFAT